MSDIHKKCGHYLGTEKNMKWWSRYRKEGFLTRGICDFWLDDDALYFQHNLLQKPLKILLKDIRAVRTGKWHCGRWAGGAPVVKIDWEKDDTLFSSGFVISREGLDTARFLQRIETAISRIG